MKQLIMLITIVTLSLTAFSQKDTIITPVKCIPIPILKLMIKDIISGDGAKEQLKLTEQLLDSTEKKIVLKDSTISRLEKKSNNCENMLEMEKEKYSILESHTKKVENKLKFEIVKNKFKSIIGITAIGVLTFFLIIK